MAYTDKDRERFIEILAKNVGNVAGACRAMNINRRTYYNWMEKHEDFKVVVEDITEALIDDAESQLQKLIGDGNVVAILFYLKTRAKSRGYIERSETDITSKGDKIKININLDETPNC
jgi:transposase-like protein